VLSHLLWREADTHPAVLDALQARYERIVAAVATVIAASVEAPRAAVEGAARLLSSACVLPPRRRPPRRAREHGPGDRPDRRGVRERVVAGLTRRRLLAAAASSAAVATAAALLPSNVRREIVTPPSRRASLGDIRHVVLLMQENRSFDHYFGTLSGVRGFADANALWLPDGASVFQQPDAGHAAGHLLPFHWTPGPRAPRRSRRPRTPGKCSTTPGTAAGWTAGWPPTAAPTERTRPT
jgi:hypothetical protein